MESYGWQCLQSDGLGKTFDLSQKLADFGEYVNDDMFLKGFAKGSTGTSIAGQNTTGTGGRQNLKDHGKIIVDSKTGEVKRYGDHIHEMLERGPTTTDDQGNPAFEAEAEGIVSYRSGGRTRVYKDVLKGKTEKQQWELYVKQLNREHQAELDALEALEAGDTSSWNEMVADSTRTVYVGNDFFIEQMHADGSTLRSWSLKNAFPRAVNWGDLSYESDELVSVELVIAYDYAVVHEFESEPQSES